MSTHIPLTDHHKDQLLSELYVYRPQYIEAVVDKIQEFMRSRGSGFQFAVDVCCANGRGTVPLTKFCDKVLGFDVSETQLAHTPKDIPNLEFRYGDAHGMSTFLAPESVDLITVGTCFHWLEKDKFLRQVDQALKPGGVLAVYNFRYSVKVEPKSVQNLMEQFMNRILGEFKDHTFLTALYEDYKDVELPYPEWIRDDTGILHHDYNSVDDFRKFLLSNSFLLQYMRKFPDKNPIEELSQQLEQVMSREREQDSTYDGKIKTTWQVFVLMGQKPRT